MHFYFFFTHGQCVYMMVGLWCFTPLNNISAISLLSVLLEETGVPGENPQPIASLYETFSHNVVSSTPRLSEVRTHNYHTISTAPAMYMKTVYRFWLFHNWSIFNSFHNNITWIVSDCFLTPSEQPVFALITWCCIRSGSSKYQFDSFWFYLTMFRTHNLPH